MSNISPEFALLGFLVPEPGYGYELHQKLNAELGNVWRLSQSQAYAILKRLEMRGDVTSHEVAQDKLPARQILQLTQSGKKRFEKWLNGTGRNARSIRLEFLTRLYFSRLYPPDRIAQIYQAQWTEIRASIHRLENLIECLPSGQVYNHLSLELRLRQLRVIQEWLGEIKLQFNIPNESV